MSGPHLFDRLHIGGASLNINKVCACDPRDGVEWVVCDGNYHLDNALGSGTNEALLKRIVDSYNAMSDYRCEMIKDVVESVESVLKNVVDSNTSEEIKHECQSVLKDISNMKREKSTPSDHMITCSTCGEAAEIAIRPFDMTSSYYTNSWNALCMAHYEEFIISTGELNKKEMLEKNRSYGSIMWETRGLNGCRINKDGNLEWAK